jgi:hypothetical protein
LNGLMMAVISFIVYVLQSVSSRSSQTPWLALGST